MELEDGRPVRVGVSYEILAQRIEAIKNQGCAPGTLLHVAAVDIWNEFQVAICNPTVFDKEWLRKAVENFAAMGRDVAKVSDHGKSRKGWSGDTPRPCRSVPSLLPQHCQAAMTLVKLMAESKSTIEVKDNFASTCQGR